MGLVFVCGISCACSQGLLFLWNTMVLHSHEALGRSIRERQTVHPTQGRSTLVRTQNFPFDFTDGLSPGKNKGHLHLLLITIRQKFNLVSPYTCSLFWRDLSSLQYHSSTFQKKSSGDCQKKIRCQCAVGPSQTHFFPAGYLLRMCSPNHPTEPSPARFQ